MPAGGRRQFVDFPGSGCGRAASPPPLLGSPGEADGSPGGVPRGALRRGPAAARLAEPAALLLPGLGTG